MSAAKTCPVCEAAPRDAAYAPFCGKRCADVDLQRWFAGRYAVPGRPAGASDGDGRDGA